MSNGPLCPKSHNKTRAFLFSLQHSVVILCSTLYQKWKFVFLKLLVSGGTAGHHVSSTAEAENEWRYAPTPPYASFTFYLNQPASMSHQLRDTHTVKPLAYAAGQSELYGHSADGNCGDGHSPWSEWH